MNAVIPVRPLPTRARRRRIVTAYAAGSLGTLILLALRLLGLLDTVNDVLKPLLLGAYLLAFGVFLYGAAYLVFPARLGLPQGHKLDEREAVRVAQANSAAYRGLTLTVLLGAELVFFFGADLSALQGRADGVQGVALLLLLVLPLLPTAILAWTEPDTGE